MKRKRNQIEETSHDNKKFRLYESTEQINNNFDSSFENKKEDFILTQEIAENEILSDISGNKWRIGVPVGKGSFGEIFLASNDISRPVNCENSSFVTKIEPHSNGPLFVEIHCLLNVNKRDDDDESLLPKQHVDVGIPKFISSGSHYFSDSRYRFLIMPRYKTDLHSILKCGRLSQRHFLVIASQIIDILKHLHEKHYVHSDIKAENIMVGRCHAKLSTNKTQAFAENPCYKPAQVRRNNEQSDFLSNNTRRSHNLRPTKKVAYILDENSRSSNSPESIKSDDYDEDCEQDEDFAFSPKKKTSRKSPKKIKKIKCGNTSKIVKEKHSKFLFDENDDERVFVIDYGLATKFVNIIEETIVHKPFCCDERRAHDGTLEFTSRDAHFGAHSRRSDLECFGYNLIFWSQGYLPWKDEKLKEQPEIVHRLKEIFMTDVKEMLKLLYGKDVPKYLGEFMEYVGRLEFDEEPDYKFLKSLFEKEFVKIGFKKSDMKLNLNEMREECVKIEKHLSENELMLSKIADINIARLLGFLIATDSVDGTEIQTKSHEVTAFNVSCKASPKNLRSKEKTKGKRSKRQVSKLTEKEHVIEKMSQGKKLSLCEIALLDPDQFAKARADREYEKLDEKGQTQTPQKYHGNPTYAILEIESRLKLRQTGIASTSNVNANGDMEPIKGYTKQMMEVLKKQQISVEKQILTPQSKKSKAGIIKETAKPLKTKTVGRKRKLTKIMPVEVPTVITSRRKSKKEIELVETKEISLIEPVVEKSSKAGRKTQKRGTYKEKPKVDLKPQKIEIDEAANEIEEIEPKLKRKRGRPKKIITSKIIIKSIIETPETEEDSVYYDIPGEGSNYDTKDVSEDENVSVSQKSLRNVIFTSGEESNHASVDTSSKGKNKKGKTRSYYADDDYDASSDEVSVVSSIAESSESKKNSRRKNIQLSVKTTRNKTKSRSTSVSAPIVEEDSEPSECSELSETEYEAQSGEDSDEIQLEYDQSETEEEEDSASESDVDYQSSNDSVDFKYSPITKTKSRRNEFRNIKTSKGRRINVINENVRNFRLISTQG